MATSGNLESAELTQLLQEKGNPPPADQLRRLWEIPEKVPEDFRVPEGARLALASGSDDKRKSVTAVWNELGGKGIIITKSVEEDLIKAYLRQRNKIKNKLAENEGSPDIYRVLDIAGLKAGLTSDELLRQHGATHVMGLDIDVAVWPDEEPLGTPQDAHELEANLERMRGNIITVNTAAAVRKLGSEDTTSERVHINIPVGKFDIDTYVEEHGSEVIGRVAGGIDFSDPASFQFLGDGTVTVERELHFSPHFAPETQLFRTVGVFGEKRQELLSLMPDYFKGASKDMLKWVIYESFRDK